MRTIQSNSPAAWREAGGFGTGCNAPACGSANVTQTVSGNVVTVNMTNVIGILRGDTNADRVVNSGDSQQTRNRAGQTADGINFRSDVNTDGTINSGDSTIVRNASGDFLP